jgi:hypothetical protein
MTVYGEFPANNTECMYIYGSGQHCLCTVCIVLLITKLQTTALIVLIGIRVTDLNTRLTNSELRSGI